MGGASLVGPTFFLANNSNYQAYPTDFTGTVAGIWTNTATNGAMNDLVASGPVINASLVVGTAGINDGLLRVFNAADGIWFCGKSTSRKNGVAPKHFIHRQIAGA